MNFIEKVFGTHSDRELKRIMPLVDKVEALRPTMQALTDEQLRAKTQEYKDRLANGETLDDLLPEAYATVREGAKRAILDRQTLQGIKWAIDFCKSLDTDYMTEAQLSHAIRLTMFRGQSCPVFRG